MKNIPKKIYLVLGNECPTDDGVDFGELAEVGWCADRLSENDIEYTLSDEPMPEETALTRLVECFKDLDRHGLLKPFLSEYEAEIQELKQLLSVKGE